MIHSEWIFQVATENSGIGDLITFPLAFQGFHNSFIQILSVGIQRKEATKQVMRTEIWNLSLNKVSVLLKNEIKQSIDI